MFTPFTWFTQFTEIYVTIEDMEQRAAFVMAVIDYGARGIEPDLPYPLSTFFASIRGDIDNSVNSRTKNTGGRPKKQQVSQPTIFDETNGSDVSETGGFDESEQGVSIPDAQDGNPALYSPSPSPSLSPKPSPKGSTAGKPPYDAIIAYLNEKAGTGFKASAKATQSLISGRWREGYTLEDFKAVIDARVSAWKNNPEMSEYLRPSTLFSASKFEGYLEAAKKKCKAVSEYAKYDG